MKVVLDSNVIVAAFAARGLCHALFEVCLQGHQLVLSEQLLKEIGKALHLRFRVPSDKVREVLLFLEDQTELRRPAPVKKGLCRDPKDAAVLGLAVAAAAEALVSGDKDLLVLKEFQGIPILSPRDFWLRVRGGTQK